MARRKKKALWQIGPMSDPTEQELKIARGYWDLHGPRFSDSEVRPFLELKSQTSTLKSARQSLLLSTAVVANKLSIPRGNYSRLEANEENGSITLKSLKNAAEAMDCELIYAIVPKSRKAFSDLIWEVLLPRAISQMTTKKHMKVMRGFFIGSLAIQQLNSTKFRKTQGLNKRVRA